MNYIFVWMPCLSRFISVVDTYAIGRTSWQDMWIDIRHGATRFQSCPMWSISTIGEFDGCFEQTYSCFAETDCGKANGGRMEASGVEESS